MKPIIFNTEMVKAILDGRKTVTRRILKLPKSIWTIDKDCEIFQTCLRDGTGLINAEEITEYFSPIKKADILWVRETWRPLNVNYPNSAIDYAADWNAKYFENSKNDNCGKWHPSIHMPRDAARIFLKVTDVRVERLQDITVEDCMAEGISCNNEIRNPNPETHESIKNWNKSYAQFLFKDLWDSTIKKTDIDKHGWNANPWVWVIEFEKIDKELISNANKNA